MPFIESDITVDYEEAAGSPVESVDEDGQFSGTRSLICDWADRYTLVNDILGTTPVDGTFTLPNPWQGHVDQGLDDPARAIAVNRLAPFYPDEVRDETGKKTTPSTSDRAAYTKAIIDFRYGRVFIEQDDTGGGADVLITERLEANHELLTLPHRQVAWVTDFGDGPADELYPVDDVEVPARVLVSCGFVSTFYRVRPPISQNFVDMLGKINSGAITSRRYGITFPAKTLLYDDFSVTGQFYTVDGEPITTVETRFLYRKNVREDDGAVLGWNGYWRAAASDFDELTTWEHNPGSTATRAAGNKIEYPTANLAALGLAQG